MRLKAIVCQVFTREIALAVSRSPHTVDVEILPMGLHEHKDAMRMLLQQRIDAADGEGYDAIILGYALCGRGTEGLRARSTPLVLPRAHDCIGVLMGGHASAMAYFETHPGVYYRSPGWVEFVEPGSLLRPATEKNIFAEQRAVDAPIADYGPEPGNSPCKPLGEFEPQNTGLTYISTGVPGEEEFRRQARAEAEAEQYKFDECLGSFAILERLVCGTWSSDEFLVVPPGAGIQAVPGSSIVGAA